MGCGEGGDGSSDIFLFRATACCGVLNTVIAAGNLQLLTQRGDVLVLLPCETRKGAENIGVFAILCLSDCDAVYNYVAGERAVEIGWWDNGIIGWFLQSWDTVEVSSFSALEPIA